MKNAKRSPILLSRGKAVLLLVSSVVLSMALTGCGGDNNQSSSPPPPPPSPQEFVYVANGGSDDVSAFKVDVTAGTFAPVQGSPFRSAAPGASINDNVPGAVTANPSGKFLYVGNADSSNISAFSVNPSTGVLTEISGSPFLAGAPAWIRIHPSGKFLYAANFDQGSVSAFNIDPVTGALAQITGSPFSLNGLVFSIAMHPSGNFAYVTFSDQNTSLNIAVFKADTNTGALTVISNASLADKGGELTMHPSGKFLYSARSNKFFGQLPISPAAPGVRVLAVDATSGALSSVGTEPPFAMNAVEAAIDPSGKFLYAADDVTGTVGHFAIDSGTGTVTHLQDVSAGSEPFGATASPFGKFLYVTNVASTNLSVFKIDPSSGALTPLTGTPFSTGLTPRSVVAVKPPA